jgi:small subunit ribosomal protein S3
MIERKIVKDKLKEFMVGEFISTTLERVEHSHTFLQKTPLGEKIIIHSARPGLIVGPKGSNIKRLTKLLKTRFRLENPQIEIEEVTNRSINPTLIAEYIAGTLERFGSSGFKGVGYRSMDEAMKAGALGIEILISGKIPSSRARTWRFYTGYLKKCGDVAFSGVKTAYRVAKLKTGVVGIQVRIMPPDLVLPDKVILKSSLVVEEDSVAQTKEKAKEVEEKAKEQESEEKPAKEEKPTKEDAPKAEKKATKKKAPKKKDAKKDSVKEAPAKEVAEPVAEEKKE